MRHQELIQQLRQRYDGFNDPANEHELKLLEKSVGYLPTDVLELYRDHNGSPGLLTAGDSVLAARLMPIEEAIETSDDMGDVAFTKKGDIAWLWTDDNSNYAGIYANGLLEGWWVKADHEEPVLTPCWRSLAGFLKQLLGSAPDVASEEERAVDLIMIPREVPTLVDDPEHLRADRLSVAMFHELFEEAIDEDLRRFYAACAITLTPVADTPTVIPYLAEDDMWTPENAINLLDLRGYSGPVADIERLARHGSPNGDAAAMRLLIRMDTAESRAAVDRLCAELAGQKKQTLEWIIRNKHRLQPPRRY